MHKLFQAACSGRWWHHRIAQQDEKIAPKHTSMLEKEMEKFLQDFHMDFAVDSQILNTKQLIKITATTDANDIPTMAAVLVTVCFMQRDAKSFTSVSQLT